MPDLCYFTIFYENVKPRMNKLPTTQGPKPQRKTVSLRMFDRPQNAERATVGTAPKEQGAGQTARALAVVPNRWVSEKWKK